MFLRGVPLNLSAFAETCWHTVKPPWTSHHMTDPIIKVVTKCYEPDLCSFPPLLSNHLQDLQMPSVGLWSEDMLCCIYCVEWTVLLEFLSVIKLINLFRCHITMRSILILIDYWYVVVINLVVLVSVTFWQNMVQKLNLQFSSWGSHSHLYHDCRGSQIRQRHGVL